MTFAQLLIASRGPRRLLFLVAIWPLVIRAQAQTNPVPATSTAAPTGGPISPVAYARQAQSEFERARREGLGFSSGGATSEPDVQFGTIFYWNNNNDVPPPSRAAGDRRGAPPAPRVVAGSGAGGTHR